MQEFYEARPGPATAAATAGPLPTGGRPAGQRPDRA